MLIGFVLAVALLVGAGLYYWWQHRPLNPNVIHRRAAFPAMMRLRRSTLMVVLGLAILSAVVITALFRSAWMARGDRKAATHAAQHTTSLQGRPELAFLKDFPKEYTKPTPPPEEKPLPPRGTALPPREIGVAHGATNGAIPATHTPSEGLSKAETQLLIERAISENNKVLENALRTLAQGQQRAMEDALAKAMHSMAGRQAAVTPEVVEYQRKVKQEEEDRVKKRKEWTAASIESMQYGDPVKTAAQAHAKEEKVSTLLQEANWVEPDNPQCILFRHQFIPGILEDVANSDIPGQLRIRVTRDVLDAEMRGYVLIPKHSAVLTVVQGQPNFGQTLFDINAEQIIMPRTPWAGMRILQLPKAKVGEANGQTGMKADVNNHWVKLGAATIFNAVLALGSNAIAGTPSGYYPNPGQQAAREVTQQVNSDLNKIVDRQLRVPPTLTQAVGHEVTIKMHENINLCTAPVRVP